MRKDIVTITIFISIWFLVPAMAAVFVQLQDPSGDRFIDGDLNITGKIIGVESEKTWVFTSPAGGSGTFYWGGYYDFAATHNDFSPSTTFGTADASYAAHFMVVLGGPTVDELTININGTSINDEGVRVEGDAQDLVFASGTPVNTMNETSKKFLGQVTVEATSGTAVDTNYGWAKYWDSNNNNFIVSGIDVTWLSGANDAGADLSVIHHSIDNWTYNAGAEPTVGGRIANMNNDHVTENDVVNGENGAWKRDNLDVFIEGGDSEGTIIEVVTTANKAFELGNFIVRVKTV